MTLTIQARAQQTIADSVLKNTLLLIESLKDNYREHSIRGHQHSLNRFDATPGYHQQKIDELKSGKCDIDYQIVTGKKYHKVVYVGMKRRHQSYNCGTRKSRKKGTCSVTNFNITETQYAAIMNGKRIEWYVYDVPLAEVTINVWGKKITYNAKTYYKYESELCNKYQEMIGHYPLLSSNSGVE